MRHTTITTNENAFGFNQARVIVADCDAMGTSKCKAHARHLAVRLALRAPARSPLALQRYWQPGSGSLAGVVERISSAAAAVLPALRPAAMAPLGSAGLA
ncbi:MAG: hypothetical protein HY000_16615 [Planctomycetes bacterium]|nr:hypothetical protein [Planctomycetota bacterium]